MEYDYAASRDIVVLRQCINNREREGWRVMGIYFAHHEHVAWFARYKRTSTSEYVPPRAG